MKETIFNLKSALALTLTLALIACGNNNDKYAIGPKDPKNPLIVQNNILGARYSGYFEVNRDSYTTFLKNQGYCGKQTTTTSNSLFFSYQGSCDSIDDIIGLDLIFNSANSNNPPIYSTVNLYTLRNPYEINGVGSFFRQMFLPQARPRVSSMQGAFVWTNQNTDLIFEYTAPGYGRLGNFSNGAVGASKIRVILYDFNSSASDRYEADIFYGDNLIAEGTVFNPNTYQNPHALNNPHTQHHNSSINNSIPENTSNDESNSNPYWWH